MDENISDITALKIKTKISKQRNKIMGKEMKADCECQQNWKT